MPQEAPKKRAIQLPAPAGEHRIVPAETGRYLREPSTRPAGGKRTLRVDVRRSCPHLDGRMLRALARYAESARFARDAHSEGTYFSARA